MAARRRIDPDSWGTEQVARALRISEATVRRYSSLEPGNPRRIPHYLTPGGQRRYREREIRAYGRDVLEIEGG